MKKPRQPKTESTSVVLMASKAHYPLIAICLSEAQARRYADLATIEAAPPEESDATAKL
jgi:hypothetical protein